MGAIGGRSNGADRSNRCNGCNRSNGVGRSNGCNGADSPDSQSYLVSRSVHAEKAIALIPRAPRRSYKERPRHLCKVIRAFLPRALWGCNVCGVPR